MAKVRFVSPFVRDGAIFHSVAERKQRGYGAGTYWVTDCGAHLRIASPFMERETAEKVGSPCSRCFR